MDAKTTISATEARRRFFDILDEIQKPAVRYIFTQRGRPRGVLMSAEEYESWLETLEVMMEIPDLAKDVAETKRDIKSGRYKNYTTLEELMAKDGYGIPAPRKTKSRKRNS